MLKKCPNCGNLFYVTEAGWGYAYDEEYVCSYTCMRTMKRVDEMTEEQRQEIDRLHAEGYDNMDIAGQLQLPVSTVGGYLGAKKRMMKAAKVAEKILAVNEMERPKETANKLLMEAGEQLGITEGEEPKEKKHGKGMKWTDVMWPENAPDPERVIGLMEEMLRTVRAMYGIA